jgi:hypothetical protein
MESNTTAVDNNLNNFNDIDNEEFNNNSDNDDDNYFDDIDDFDDHDNNNSNNNDEAINVENNNNQELVGSNNDNNNNNKNKNKNKKNDVVDYQTIKENVVAYLKCIISLKNENVKLKLIREQKKKCHDFVLKYLEENKQDYINTPYGAITKVEKKKKSPIKDDDIKESIMEHIQKEEKIDDDAKRAEITVNIMNSIKEKRGEKTEHMLKPPPNLGNKNKTTNKQIKLDKKEKPKKNKNKK